MLHSYFAGHALFKEFAVGGGGAGWLGIRLFAALIRNTCSLVPRFLPMGKILVTKLEYMYVFDHFCHCTQGSHKFMMTCIDTYQYRANIPDKFKECRTVVWNAFRSKISFPMEKLMLDLLIAVRKCSCQT